MSTGIKMLKRQMFGRAGFELLRKRVLLYSLRWRYAWSWTPSHIATIVAQLEDPFEVMRGGVFFDLLKPV
ncbi:hypothetical protein ACIQHU_16570 [Streptomyces tendae]|uniref:hypothetical protein n=1 Tax=Streptomyces tendae TaxID=1932 RepID=UPI00344A9AE2